MKLTLISIGKTDNSLFTQIIDDYIKRISFYIPFEIIIVPDLKNRKNISEKEQKRLEGESLAKVLQPSDYKVLLDEKGKQYRSTEFAKYIGKKMYSISI